SPGFTEPGGELAHGIAVEVGLDQWHRVIGHETHSAWLDGASDRALSMRAPTGRPSPRRCPVPCRRLVAARQALCFALHKRAGADPESVRSVVVPSASVGRLWVTLAMLGEKACR